DCSCGDASFQVLESGDTSPAPILSAPPTWVLRPVPLRKFRHFPSITPRAGLVGRPLLRLDSCRMDIGKREWFSMCARASEVPTTKRYWCIPSCKHATPDVLSHTRDLASSQSDA